LGIPNLVELDVNKGFSGRIDGEVKQLLEQCRTLLSLQITCKRTCSILPTPTAELVLVSAIEDISTPVMASPLDELNPDSFATLTHLTMNMINMITESDALLSHPYQSLPSCNTLRHLSRLENVVLNIAFYGTFLVHPSAFGPFTEWEELCPRDEWGSLPPLVRDIRIPQWTEIYDIISNRDEFPVLKKFEVNIYVHYQHPSRNVEGVGLMNSYFVACLKAYVENR
jgi:hypothetical protein